MIIRSFADHRELSCGAAQAIADQIRAKPGAVLGLAAGNTPVGTYRELVRMYREESLDFSRVVFFNLDEYEGWDEHHPGSFARFLNEHFLGHINVDRSNVHLLRFLPDSHMESYCEAFEAIIRNAGGIDLQILGIGRNGHIAFNEPGSPFNSRTRVVTLAHSRTTHTPETAVTMGIGTIVEARKILLLASGNEKADILAAAIHGPVTEAIPASVLQRHADVLIMTDELCRA